MSTDARTGLEVIPREECMRLLASHHLGRLGVTVSGRPLIFPVNYALDGDLVVFRTAEGTKLHGAIGHDVAFEIDGCTPLYHEGWSVLVIGRAEAVTADQDLERVRSLPVLPWGPGDHPHWVRIRPGAVTGRRIPPHHA